jgi:hypothetical protein
MQLGGRADSLHPFIWSCESGLMRFGDGSFKRIASVHQILCISKEKCKGDPGNDYTNIPGRKCEPYTGSPNSLGLKKTRQVKTEVNSLLAIFFHIKEISHKEFVLAGQAINSAYYCDILRRLHDNVRSLHLKLWQQKNWLLDHDNTPSHTSFFTREFLAENNMTVVPHLPYMSLFP